MAFASGGSVDLTYVLETEFGVTPATPAMRYLPVNSTSVGLTREQLQSGRLRSDRQLEHLRFGNRSVAGDAAFELSHQDFDDILAAVFFTTWTANVLEGAGSVPTTLTVQRRHLDVDQFFTYVGTAVNTFEFSLQPGQIVSGTIGLIARDSARGATLGDPADMISNEPYDSFTGSLLIGGDPVLDVTGISVSVDNGIEPNFVLFSDLTREYSSRKNIVTGEITVPFTADTAAYIDNFLNEEETSLQFTVGGGGTGQTWLFPRIKLTSADLPVPDDGPLSLTLPFQCLFDQVTGTNVRVTRNI